MDPEPKAVEEALGQPQTFEEFFRGDESERATAMKLFDYLKDARAVRGRYTWGPGGVVSVEGSHTALEEDFGDLSSTGEDEEAELDGYYNDAIDGGNDPETDSPNKLPSDEEGYRMIYRKALSEYLGQMAKRFLAGQTS